MTTEKRPFENPENPHGSGSGGGGDVTDADLIRYLDGELETAATARLEERVRRDADLAARLEELSGRSRRLATLLAEVVPTAAELASSAGAIRAGVHRPPHAVPAFGEYRTSPFLRVAAVIVLLLGMTLAVQPARAWVIERVREVAAVLGFEVREWDRQPPAPVDAVEPVDPAVAVTFQVRTDTFQIELAGAAGTLLVRRGGELGTADAVGLPDARFVLLPSGLRIEAPEPVEAVFRLSLPSAVQVLRVSTAGAPHTFHDLPPGDEALRIDLGQP